MATKDKELPIGPPTQEMLDEAAEKRWIIDVLVDELISDNVRDYPPQAVQTLAESIRQNGLLLPLTITTKLELFDGWGRTLALKLLGWKTAPARVIKSEMSRTEWKVGQLTTSIHLQKLTDYELYENCAGLLKLRADWDQKALAKHLAEKEWNISRWLSPSGCNSEVRDALKTGKIGISDCVRLARVPEDEQAAILAERLNGTISNLGELERAVRTRKKQPASAASGRTSRRRAKATFVSTSGTTTAISGERLDMAEMIEVLSELLKLARKADQKGWDLATFEQVQGQGKRNSEGEVAA